MRQSPRHTNVKKKLQTASKNCSSKSDFNDVDTQPLNYPRNCVEDGATVQNMQETIQPGSVRDK